MLIIPVAEYCMELDDAVLLLLGECTSLEIRAEVVYPAQAAALATPLES